MNITIYHNPACSKSRKTLEIIKEHGIEPRIVEYLKATPDEATIRRLAKLLQTGVAGIMRTSDPEFGSAADKPEETDDAALAEWLVQHPAVLQRPIVVDEERNAAVMGRPPEAVLGLLSGPPGESSAGS